MITIPSVEEVLVRYVEEGLDVEALRLAAAMGIPEVFVRTAIGLREDRKTQR